VARALFFQLQRELFAGGVTHPLCWTRGQFKLSRTLRLNSVRRYIRPKLQVHIHPTTRSAECDSFR